MLKSSDIWAVGVITYMMITGKPPFKGVSNTDICSKIAKNPITFPEEIKLSDEVKDFIAQCLNKNTYTAQFLSVFCVFFHKTNPFPAISINK